MPDRPVSTASIPEKAAYSLCPHRLSLARKSLSYASPPSQPAKPRNGCHPENFIGSPDFAIGEVRKPFEFQRNIGELILLCLTAFLGAYISPDIMALAGSF
jgi:hypothetical protein